jgi:beta-ribofuranosylaminobenzene 5'-phosphate synthase
MTHVCITTGARLHFGPLSVSAPAGGRFGGVGVMIDFPRTVLTAKSASADLVRSGDESTTKRVAEFLERIHKAIPDHNRVPCEIDVKETIPAHCGFGSGTQMGLAVALATSIIAKEPEPDLDELAFRVGRGLRSAVGLHGFQQGGFLVDGGRVESNKLGTLVTRIDFPAEWRFVLASPQRAIGLSGDAEQSAFARQSAMPRLLTAELCRIVLMEWLPSVIEADFARCSDSMFEYGNAVGEFFSPTQGGVFAHPRMAAWADKVRQCGIRGVAQTSWGPTLAALCSSNAMATQLQSDFAGDSTWNDCSFQTVSPLNRGAIADVS